MRRLGSVRTRKEGIRDEGITVDFDKVAAFNVGLRLRIDIRVWADGDSVGG